MLKINTFYKIAIFLDFSIVGENKNKFWCVKSKFYNHAKYTKLEIHKYILGQATDLKLILIAVVSFSFSDFTILQYTT